MAFIKKNNSTKRAPKGRIPAIKVDTSGFRYHTWSGICRGIWLVLTGLSYGWKTGWVHNAHSTEVPKVSELLKKNKKIKAPSLCQRLCGSLLMCWTDAAYSCIIPSSWSNLPEGLAFAYRTTEISLKIAFLSKGSERDHTFLEILCHFFRECQFRPNVSRNRSNSTIHSLRPT